MEENRLDPRSYRPIPTPTHTDTHTHTQRPLTHRATIFYPSFSLYLWWWCQPMLFMPLGFARLIITDDTLNWTTQLGSQPHTARHSHTSNSLTHGAKLSLRRRATLRSTDLKPTKLLTAASKTWMPPTASSGGKTKSMKIKQNVLSSQKKSFFSPLS